MAQCPELCDNLKTGVIERPREGEIVLNTASRELAGHYSAAVLPALVKVPKDKLSAENTVAYVATWVIAKLRKQTSGSLPELQAAVGEQMAAYHREPFQKRPGSRTSVFAAEELPLMRPSPAEGYELSDWFYGRKVARNSHITWPTSS